ncbi:hypothetical protein D6C81_02853 [Aureobasidium pullulans]|nr:hypothetical protein D6C81_02853 [Aureobasidium pullulans]
MASSNMCSSSIPLPSMSPSHISPSISSPSISSPSISSPSISSSSSSPPGEFSSSDSFSSDSSITTTSTPAPNKTTTYKDEIANGIMLIFDGKVKLVDRELLRSASAVFRKAFDGEFSEAATNSYKIQDHSQEAVLIMIQCIQRDQLNRENTKRYFENPDDHDASEQTRNFGYDWSIELDTSDPHSFSRNVDFCLEVFLLANEYDIPTLSIEAIKLLIDLRKEVLMHGLPFSTDEIVDKVVELYDTNHVSTSSLMQRLASESVWSPDEVSEIYCKVEARYGFIEGIWQHIGRRWGVKDQYHTSFVLEMNKVQEEKELAENSYYYYDDYEGGCGLEDYYYGNDD